MSTTRPDPPVPYPQVIDVRTGPALLGSVQSGPSLHAHRERYGPRPRLGSDEILALCAAVALRGRGGAGFPFARKLRAVLDSSTRRRRPTLVVNLSEGEPASAKDAGLAQVAPHLILDGAAATADAVGARTIHVVLPSERPRVAASMHAALRERDDDPRLRWRAHTTEPGFVAGQARAVIELIEGRPNLPVTAWQPEAICGIGGRPTLLSNAETWAQLGHLVSLGVAEYTAYGTCAEPGTTLLTIGGPGRVPIVCEVPHGTMLKEVVPDDAAGAPMIIGGFHGVWATWATASALVVSDAAMRDRGLSLGAGVVYLPEAGATPAEVTTEIVDYLAGQSAGRCGPCRNGLPALAAAMPRGGESVERLTRLVERRGACAHPDGTVRLVRSLLALGPSDDEVAAR